MENEKKHNKILEVILIVLVALSFVLLPLLNQYRQKIISSNNTQLVKRQVNGDGSSIIGKNGNVSFATITTDVYTFYSNSRFFTLDLSDTAYQNLISGGSISGTTDDFGYNCTNYFRFVYNSKYTNALSTEFDKIYDLVYYIELDNSNSLSIVLGYWQIIKEPTGISFTSIDDSDFDNFGIIPFYSVLNVSYYNFDMLSNGLLTYLDSLGIDTYLVATSNYQLPNDIFVNHSLNRTKFVNIDKDFITPVENAVSTESYTSGYKDGYKIGFNEGTSNEGVFSMLKHAANTLQDFLNIEVLPNISLWLLISIPLSISIMLIMFRLLRGGN